jgi:hypothetical protein
VELQQDVDTLYCRNPRTQLNLLTSTGDWSCERHPRNGKDGARGDESSIQNRYESVKHVGILKIRKGPWFTKKADSDRFLLMHSATLLQGAERAFTEDTERKNIAVQISVAVGFDDAKEYDPRTPDDVVDFLIYLGSVTNANSTDTTVLEKWEKSKDADLAFSRKKQSMKWTLALVRKGRATSVLSTHATV